MNIQYRFTDSKSNLLLFVPNNLKMVYLYLILRERNMITDQDNDIERTKSTDPLLEALDKLGCGSNFLWIIFIFTLTPTIFNGMHSMSYIFIAEVRLTRLSMNGTLDIFIDLDFLFKIEIRNISVPIKNSIDT